MTSIENNLKSESFLRDVFIMDFFTKERHFIDDIIYDYQGNPFYKENKILVYHNGDNNEYFTSSYNSNLVTAYYSVDQNILYACDIKETVKSNFYSKRLITNMAAVCTIYTAAGSTENFITTDYLLKEDVDAMTVELSTTFYKEPNRVLLNDSIMKDYTGKYILKTDSVLTLGDSKIMHYIEFNLRGTANELS